METLLEAKQLTKQYKGLTAVAGYSVQISRGKPGGSPQRPGKTRPVNY